MEPEYTPNSLRNLFQSSFNLTEWYSFLQHFFHASELKNTPEKIEGIAGDGYYLGKIDTTDYCVGLFYYNITKGSVANKRVGLRNLVKPFINSNYGDFDAALVVFNSGDHWRLSFICDIKGEETSPKRYTFLFGDSNNRYNTAVTRFLHLQRQGMTFDNVKETFSVEALSKEFYQRLFRWYQWALSKEVGVTFPNDPNITSDDRENLNIKLIRLITRLLFVWFIKQKELVPDCLFSSAYLGTILKNFDKDSKKDGCFYNAILQNLFFATLNCTITNKEGDCRSFASATHHRDTKNRYRYAEMFKISEKEVIQLFSKVPFLNGGLFECLDKPKDLYVHFDHDILYDGFSRNGTRATNGNYKYRAFVPNNLFFSENEQQPGLITLLNEYNFTVEENNANDAVVSLDPELLGQVFENLLAAYNPETQESARNLTGSFYTPRVIVDYMVKESIIAYIKAKQIIGVEENDLRELFDKREKSGKWSEGQVFEMTKALKEIKILDPACGSGAFPMGCLLRIVEIIEVLNDDKIDRYRLKLEIIENCIYGVDIQSIAMLICKLRFFISLICDQENIDFRNSENNFGVNTLPNLETKFVAANSLVSPDIKKDDYKWLEDEKLMKLKEELLAIRKDHFMARRRRDKLKYQRDDEKKREEIREYIEMNSFKPNEDKIALWERELIKQKNELEKYKDEVWVDLADASLQREIDWSDVGTTQPRDSINNKFTFRVDKNKKLRDKAKQYIKNIETDIDKERNKSKPIGFLAAVEQITDWDPYDQNSVSPFFDPEWMFGVQEGFDIVIGNPPYISTKGVSAKEKTVYEKEFGFSDDTYNLFTFKGLSLCRDNGSLTFVIPKTFWTTQTKRNMRELLLSNTIEQIFDTADPFEAAMVDTCVVQVRKSHVSENHEVRFLDGTENLATPIVLNPVKQNLYAEAQNKVIFKPTPLNLRIYELYNDKVKALYEKWWDKIKTSRDIEKNKQELVAYRKSLQPGDVTLLGCLTEGGQGLATANNGKYIAVRRSTKWATHIELSRPKKLAEAIKKNKIYLPTLKDYNSEKEFLASLSEKEIAQLFDSLKKKYGRDIFGQGYLYKIIEDEEIADVDTLSQDEKENGIDINKKYYVPYDKGDKDGNRWYLETPFAIAWSKENVRYLKTNSGKKGEGMPVVRNPQFYFREGLCWSDINTILLKCRKKSKTIHDVKSMSIFSVTGKVPNEVIITLINSKLVSCYVNDFVNNTQTFQINDARLLPIVVPGENGINEAEQIVKAAINTMKQRDYSCNALEKIQERVDYYAMSLYNIYR